MGVSEVQLSESPAKMLQTMGRLLVSWVSGFSEVWLRSSADIMGLVSFPPSVGVAGGAGPAFVWELGA